MHAFRYRLRAIYSSMVTSSSWDAVMLLLPRMYTSLCAVSSAMLALYLVKSWPHTFQLRSVAALQSGELIAGCLRGVGSTVDFLELLVTYLIFWGREKTVLYVVL
jgi:hypothetical protein